MWLKVKCILACTAAESLFNYCNNWNLNVVTIGYLICKVNIK